MSKKRSKSFVIIITVILFLGMFVPNYGQYQLSAVPSIIYEKFMLTDAQFSSIMTAPMIPAIFLSIIMGIMADKFGITKVVSVSFIITMIGFIMRCFATDYTMVFVSMVLTGVAATALNSNLSKIVASMYPLEKMGKVIGILMAGSTGSMAVAYATTAIIPSVEIAFWIAAILSIVVAGGWLLFAREKYFVSEEAPAHEPVPLKETLSVSLKSKNIWLMGLSLLFLLGGVMVITNFQVVALTSLKGVSEATAGTFGTVLMIGSILGSIFVPSFLMKSKNMALFMLVGGIIAAASTVCIVMAPIAVIYAASFLNGFIRSGVIATMMAFPVMFKEIGPKYAGTAGGIAVTLELVGAVIIPTYVVIPLGGGNMITYFWIGAACIAISAVLAFILCKTGLKTDK